MKLITGVVAITLAASASFAQSKPAPVPAQQQQKTAAPSAVKPAAPAPHAQAAQAPKAQPAKAAKPSAAPKKAAKPAQAAKQGHVVEKPRTHSHSVERRDPFVSVVVERGKGTCSAGGKKCIVPDQVKLQGVVKASDGNIAVVVNQENRAYFLRENDPVFNGVVTRITESAITFKERTTDLFGRPVMREVVKKINTPSA